MSYYTIAPHHYYGHRATSPPPHIHSSPYSSPRHPPQPHHPSYDLDEEERLALAHLKAIRQRREAQQAILEREAAVRAREERDNALRRALAEKKKQQAIAEATAALKRQREYEIQQAVERERERVRAAILQQHHLRQQQQQQHQHHQAQLQAVQQERARQVQAQQQRARQLCAPRREVAREDKEVKKEQNHEYEVLSNLLGSLFGITLDDEDEKVQTKPSPIPTPAPVVAQTPTPSPPQAAESTPFPEDINDLLSHYLGLRIEPTTDTTPNPPTSKANTTPHGLNDFLSQYGLVFEPEESNSTPVEKKVSSPPTPVADPPEPVLPAPVAAFPTSTTQPTQQAQKDHPLTDYFNGMVDLPPFLRDILGHAEVAYNQRQDGEKEEAVEGKGKGVAEGEKNVVPPAPTESTTAPAPISDATSTPAPLAVETKPDPEPEVEVDDSAKSLSTLSTISSDLSLVRDSFDFPQTLAFATPSPDNSDPPALLYNKVNSGYHAQTHKLLQLLLAADAIQSNGNKEVRRRRKEIVRAVEEEIEHLEKKRDEMWETVKAAKEAGGEDQEYELVSNSSCGSSAVDPGEVKEEVEHVEDLKVEEAAGPSGHTVDVPSDQMNTEEVKESKAARVETADENEEVSQE